MEELLPVIMLSLYVSLLSTIVSTIFGIAFSILMIIKKNIFTEHIIKVMNSLMSIPPVLMGLLVFMLINKRGIFGRFGLLYTPTAIILTQICLILPIIISLSYNYFEIVGEKIRRNCIALGISKKKTIVILLKESIKPLLIVISSGFGRAISEVGSAMIVGGNIKGHTRIMTTYIAMETGKGNFAKSIQLGFILLGISLITNYLLNNFKRKRE